MKILYVEDNPDDIDFTRRELVQSAPHIKLHIAKSLSEAREQLAKSQEVFDLVLTDLHLPDGTGLELLNEIRGKNLPLAVVILTGIGDEETAVMALKAGADDYITKRKGYLFRLPFILEEALARFHAESFRKLRPLNVLYAEHNAADIDLTQKHLSRYAGHIHMDVVNTSDEALQRLLQKVSEGKPYDVLLLDYHLPGMTGLELLKTLYQENQIKVPTVLVTGYGTEEVAVQALRFGVSNYVVKNPSYLFKLPAILENSYYSWEIEREREKLAKSEARFRLIAENARDIIYRVLIKPVLAYEYISPAVTAVTGYTPEEFYANPDLGSKTLQPEAILYHSRLHQKGLEWEKVIQQFTHKDGRVIWIEQQMTPIYDNYDELIALEGIARDVTVRQQTIEALQISEKIEREQRQFAEALRDSAAALITAIDLDTVMDIILERVSQVVPNDAANFMLIENDHARIIYWRGYRPEQINYIQEVSFSISGTANLHQMFVTGLPFLISDTGQFPRWVHIPSTVWVKSNVGVPIRSHGQVIGFLLLDSGEPNFFTEIHAQNLQAFADQASIAIEHAQLYEKIQNHTKELTQRVNERTAELQQSETRYRAIIEDQTDLVCRFLPGGILTFVNQTYCQHFNETSENLLGTSFFKLVPVKDRLFLEKTIASLSPENPVIMFELPEIASDGTQAWYHWSDRMLFDENGDFLEYQGVGRDITDRKIAEDQLQQMLEHAMKLSELRSRYIAMAAHDLRNPLAVIQSTSYMIQQYGDKLTNDRKQAKFDQLYSAIKIMVNMLDDVLTIGQDEAGKLEFAPTSVDVTALCENIIEEIKQSSSASQQIEFSQQGDCTTVYLDIKLLRHILTNLLSNAIKYSSEDKVIQFELNCSSDQLVILVQDHGIGIPKAEQKQLFETFYRASNAKNISGTGLGLAIVKQSVDLHHGTIIFESQENVGTTFTVTLPRNPVQL